MKIDIHMLSVIAATMFIGLPISANGMSARPPIIYEQKEAGIYLQKDLREGSKTLVHDKNAIVWGNEYEQSRTFETVEPATQRFVLSGAKTK